MTAPLIAHLIPPRARPGSREHGRTATARRLPVAAAPVVPAVPDDVLYGFGRMDSSGRVADRAMTSALGWQPGDRLTLAAGAGVVIARRDPGGLVIMPSRPYIVIPAALRRRCGLRPGDRVLLAVFPAEEVLAVYSFAVVDQALRAYSPVPDGREGMRA
jgi:bifunctional DNA-binding transcriptional regulator/antitoxin component of YhaV-PrlF toxin-antitoxin module